jgi:hypothetical protein
MGRFQEFESPKPPEKAPDATAEQIRERFPKATALVDELRESCPELFAGATVLSMAEDGKEMKTLKYRVIESTMRPVKWDWWDRITAANERNRAYVNRGKK